MGTRLYPRTSNPAVLELLAGVPAGTHARLAVLDSKYEGLRKLISARPKGDTDQTDFIRHESLSYRRHKEIVRDEDLHSLHNLLLFGWGKVRSAVYALLEMHPDMLDGDDIYSGSCEDTGFCRDILARQGVELPAGFDPVELKGLCWG